MIGTTAVSQLFLYEIYHTFLPQASLELRESLSTLATANCHTAQMIIRLHTLMTLVMREHLVSTKDGTADIAEELLREPLTRELFREETLNSAERRLREMGRKPRDSKKSSSRKGRSKDTSFRTPQGSPPGRHRSRSEPTYRAPPQQPPPPPRQVQERDRWPRRGKSQKKGKGRGHGKRRD